MARNRTSQIEETLLCGLVSKPIGGGNSSTVKTRMAMVAASTPRFAHFGLEIGLFVGMSSSCLAAPIVSNGLLRGPKRLRI